MSEQRHIIKRQTIELIVQNAAVAPALQDEVSRVYRQRIIPLIDRYCTELGQPDRVYRIDLLELDLGVLEVDDLEEQFVAKAGTVLRKALAAQINSQEQDTSQTQRSPKTQSALELFMFFMQTGSLPWWADNSQPKLLAENLQQLLDETPQELRRLLQTTAQDEHIRQRIVSQYSDRQLAKLASLLVPVYRLFFTQDITSLKNILQKTKTGAAWQPVRLRQRLWSQLLQTAALGGEEYPSLEAFYEAVLKRIAAVLGTTSASLIDEIQQALQDDKTSSDAGTRRQKKLLEKLTQADVPPTAQGLLRRLAQLQAEGVELPAEVWARLQGIAPRLSGPLRIQWLSALNTLGKRPSAQTIAESILQRLQPELAAQQGLPAQEISKLIELLQSVIGEKTAVWSQRHRPGGLLPEIWADLEALYLRLPPEAQDSWLRVMSPLGSSTSAQAITAGIVRLLNDETVRRSLPPGEQAKLLKMLRAAPPQGEPDLRFSDADELSVANAGLVILWPFLTSFFTHLGLMEDKKFKDLAAQQRAIGLLQVVATKDAAPPEYLLPLNKLLCGLEFKQVFDFGPPLLKSEAKECANLLKAVIAQAAILHNMSAAGFRATFLLRPALLSARDGHWLLRVERKTYDIVLERFPWNWEWVKLPWMETPLRVEW